MSDQGAAATSRCSIPLASMHWVTRISREYQSTLITIGRMRDELLNEQVFDNLDHARRLLAAWRHDYTGIPYVYG